MPRLLRPEWRKGQWNAVARMFGQPAFALFADIGSGKTIMLLSEVMVAWQAGLIDGALIVSWNGVHRKWLTEELPKVTSIRCRIAATPEYPPLQQWNGGPRFFSVHREALSMKRPTWRNAAKAFLKSGRMAFIWDESQDIRTPRAKRTRVARWLAPLATYRRIASGFPNPSGMHNLYSQYTFLDPDILGMRTYGHFKSEHMVFKPGFRGYPMLIGYRNEEQFNAKVAPHTLYLEQDRTGREDVHNVERTFEMTPQQRRLWDSTLREFTMVFESGNRLDVPLAITRLIRLQQLVCGWVPVNDSWEYVNERRTHALQEVLEECSGKVVIWSQFRHCIQRLHRVLGKKSAVIDGSITGLDRERSLDQFAGTDKIQWLICQPETVGTGRNELVVANKAIYWSNGFKALTRRQSEGRLDRDGQKKAVTFIDLICEGSYDRKILDTIKSRVDVGQSFLRQHALWLKP